MGDMQRMMADQQFKNTIAQIELHKLRYGTYPASLGDIKFVPAMDSLYKFHDLEYNLLDSGYELNLNIKNGANVELRFPDEYWKGLGCVKSNVK